MADTDVTHAERIAFQMAEYAAIKGEIAELVKQTEVYLTFAITAWGGLVAWLLTTRIPQKALEVVSWLPVTLSALFGLLAGSCLLRMSAKADYVKKVEEHLALAGLGWESGRDRRPRHLIVVNTLAWGTLNMLGLLLGWLLPSIQLPVNP
jgi:hypothetical protein